MTKDQVRARVWGALESSGAAVGSPWSAIPNYKGADDAARILAGLPEFREAQVVKSNPDPAQGPFRLAALRAGKKLYTPVPELVQDTPFVLLDPEVLAHNGVAFEEVENASGFLQHGLRVEFRDIEPIDFFVVGCVAVTRAGGRTGKGAGFADLELGIMRHYGSVTPTTPIATTVHDLQVVDDGDVVMEAHDTPLDSRHPRRAHHDEDDDAAAGKAGLERGAGGSVQGHPVPEEPSRRARGLLASR